MRYCLFIAVVLLVPVILSLCASSLALLLLAVNQYLAICNPLFAQTRISHGRVGLCIVAAWLTSATAAAFPTLLMLIIHYSDDCTDYTNSMANKSIEVCRSLAVKQPNSLPPGWNRSDVMPRCSDWQLDAAGIVGV